LLRQPDGITALARPQIERSARLEPADLLDQELVGSFCPEEGRASIALIPVVRFHINYSLPMTASVARAGMGIDGAPRAFRLVWP